MCMYAVGRYVGRYMYVCLYVCMCSMQYGVCHIQYVVCTTLYAIRTCIHIILCMSSSCSFVLWCPKPSAFGVEVWVWVPRRVDPRLKILRDVPVASRSWLLQANEQNYLLIELNLREEHPGVWACKGFGFRPRDQGKQGAGFWARLCETRPTTLAAELHRIPGREEVEHIP